MSIQDTIDELKRIGKIHGFHQPVTFSAGVNYVSYDDDGDPVDNHFDIESDVSSVTWLGGQAVMEPEGEINIESD